MTDATACAPVTHHLRLLSGHRPAHVLCAWGLTSLLPGAMLHFAGTWGEPVITWAGSPRQLADQAATQMVARLWDLGSGPLAGIKTTAPSRKDVNRVVAQAWREVRTGADLPEASVIRTFDLAGLTVKKNPAGEHVVSSAALTLLTGTCHAAKTVQDMWQLLGARTEQEARQRASEEILLLLEGAVTVAEAKPGLRFSASAMMPRTTSGSEACDMQPFVDLLALCGQMLIEPAQRTLTQAGLRKGLMWFLHPVPLTIEAVIDLHESPPSGVPWPRRSALILKEPTAKFSYLSQSEPVAQPNGGHRA